MTDAATPAPVGGRPAKGERKDVLVRFPQDVLDGVIRRAEREGITSRNDAFLLACVGWGDYPGGKPAITREAPKPAKAKAKRQAPKEDPPFAEGGPFEEAV